MHLFIRDRATGAPAAAGASVRLRSATFLRDYTGPTDGLLMVISAPAGTYTVTVTKPGYLPWRQGAVVVEGTGACSIRAVTLEVQLERG